LRAQARSLYPLHKRARSLTRTLLQKGQEDLEKIIALLLEKKTNIVVMLLTHYHVS